MQRKYLNYFYFDPKSSKKFLLSIFLYFLIIIIEGKLIKEFLKKRLLNKCNRLILHR